MAGHSPLKTGVNALSSRQSIFFENRDARAIGERKRRRSSNGYRRAEATPFFKRLWASGSDAVLQTAMGERKRRRSSNGYGRAEATPFFERL